MNLISLLENLNNKQRESIVAPRTNLLVLAGAGSGKTRVLVHRIAWLQSIENCSPYSIMAVTFSNKAAAEMRNRIEGLMGSIHAGMWIGTFHGLSYRLLRNHHVDIGLSKDFQVIDRIDQLCLLKHLMKRMNLDEDQWQPRQMMYFINSKKDKGIRPHNIETFNNQIEQIKYKVYQAYQERCEQTGVVDFSELILRTYELWLNKPDILQYYRERFTNILVDEFQDTNNMQYAWINLLAGKTSKVMVVGDDDQSIYGWRGAQIENIQRFLNDFPSAQIIRLEQNYRSTSNILNAANSLIKNNNKRLGKKLWTVSITGEPVSLYCASNEIDEAQFVVNRIKVWFDSGGQLAHCAILYRSNVQSRVLEEALMQARIPYCIYGGMRFFERQEIKEALSYLRLIVNRNDDTAFDRVVNTPLRGIGNRTISVVRQMSHDLHISMWQASLILLQKKKLTRRAASALECFLKLIETLAQDTVNMSLKVQTNLVIKNSGLWRMYSEEKGAKGYIRIKNLEELVTAIDQFSKKKKSENLISLEAFLSCIALEDSENRKRIEQDSVQLMTIHSAKGLEFPQVFIVGMEEGIFPTQMSQKVGALLEEERRLAYVGITRAMQKLTLTYAKSRQFYGRKVFCRPSLFINELQEGSIEKMRISAGVN